MTGAGGWNGQMPAVRPQQQQQPARTGGGDNLADILERVLDKGIVIAGDVQINLLDIELLTIKLRLIVASVDRAKEMGIDWWERDPTLSSGQRELEDENRQLRERLAALEGRSTAEVGAGAEPDDEEGPDEEDPDTVTDAEVVEDEPEPTSRPRSGGGSGSRTRSSGARSSSTRSSSTGSSATGSSSTRSSSTRSAASGTARSRGGRSRES